MKRLKRKLLIIKIGAALLAVMICIHFASFDLGRHKVIAKRLVDQVVASGLINSESDFTYDEFGNLKTMDNYLIKNGKKTIAFAQTYHYHNGLISEVTGVSYIDGKKDADYTTRYGYNKAKQLISEKYNTTSVDGEDEDGDQYISEAGVFVKGTRPKSQRQIDRYIKYTYSNKKVVKVTLDATDLSTSRLTYSLNNSQQVIGVSSEDDTRTITLDARGNMAKQTYTILKHGNFSKKTDTYTYTNHYNSEGELTRYAYNDLGETYTLHYKYLIVRQMHESTIDRIQRLFSNRYHVYSYGLED
jgi:hypothetical protein